MSFTSRVKIEDLINNGSILVHKDGNHGAKYPRTEEFGEFGVPFLTAKLLDSSGNIDLLNAPRLATEKAKKFTFGFVQSEDVLLSHNATVGRVAVMPQVAEPILIGTSLTHFRLDKSKILPTYLAAYFSGKDFQDQLAAVMSQTTRNQVPITSQRKLYIELPSIDIQTEIVKHIDSIDNKIRLNNQINQTLESIAQAIFKSWFVDFEPVHAKIAAKQEGKDPERAAMCAISGKSEAELKQMAKEDFAELQATAALFPDELVDSELGEVPKGWELQQIKDIAKYCTNKISLKDLTLENYISTENMLPEKKGIEKASSLPKANSVPAFRQGNILVSNIRPYFKKIWFSFFDGGHSNDVLNFDVLEKGTEEYLYNLIYQDSFFDRMMASSKGSKMPRGDKKAIMDFQIVTSSVTLRKLYSEKVRKFYSKQNSIKIENQILINLRDALLPKLLLGELDVLLLRQEGA